MAKEVVKVVNKGTQGNARIMANDLKDLTPRSDKTGVHMADGWTTRNLDASPNLVTVEIYNADPRFDAATGSAGKGPSIGQILEYGSRPHEIKARGGGTLNFYWPAVGKFISVKSVQHPGTRPYGFMVIATDSALGRAEKLINAAAIVLRQTARKFSGA